VALADVRAILMIPGVRSRCSIPACSSPPNPYASSTSPSPFEPRTLVPAAPKTSDPGPPFL